MVPAAERHPVGWLLLALGVAILVALAPFATGLITIPVLYVVLEPLHLRLRGRLGKRPAAAVTTTLALLLLVVPAIVMGLLVVAQARDITAWLSVPSNRERIGSLVIGSFDLGGALAGLGAAALAWLRDSALGIVGNATRQVLNLLVALFGLYYLLLAPAETWEAFSVYLPLSRETADRLRARFRDITTSTVLGTGLVALLQGVMVGGALAACGITHAVFWGLVTVVLSILPVVGSGMVWGPAAAWLILEGRPLAAGLLAVWGVLIVGNMDFFVRPSVSRRWAHVHPLITLVGALAGVRYFGLMGLLIGPLALSWFLELLHAWRIEREQPPGLTPRARLRLAGPG